MPTNKHRLATYTSPEIYQCLEGYARQHRLSLSQAITQILAEFFGLPTASKGNVQGDWELEGLRKELPPPVNPEASFSQSQIDVSSQFPGTPPQGLSRQPDERTTADMLETDCLDWQKRLATVEAKLNLLINGLPTSTISEANAEDLSEGYSSTNNWERHTRAKTSASRAVGTENSINLEEELSSLSTSWESAAQPGLQSYTETAIKPPVNTQFQPMVEPDNQSKGEESIVNLEQNSLRSPISLSSRRVLQHSTTTGEEAIPNPRSKLSRSLSLKQPLRTPTEPLDRNQLAKRLRSPSNPWKPIKPSSISRARNKLTQSQFIEWSRTLDPQKVGWCCGGDGMYYPQQ